MIRFRIGPYTGVYGFDYQLRLENQGGRARALELELQTEINARRLVATGYHPSADVFALAALKEWGAVIVERIDPPAPPDGAAQ